MNATKYRILAGRTPDPTDGADWGYARTLETAIAKATRLTRQIRTDLCVWVTDGQTVLATAGVSHASAVGFARTLR